MDFLLPLRSWHGQRTCVFCGWIHDLMTVKQISLQPCPPTVYARAMLMNAPWSCTIEMPVTFPSATFLSMSSLVFLETSSVAMSSLQKLPSKKMLSDHVFEILRRRTQGRETKSGLPTNPAPHIWHYRADVLLAKEDQKRRTLSWEGSQDLARLPEN